MKLTPRRKSPNFTSAWVFFYIFYHNCLVLFYHFLHFFATCDFALALGAVRLNPISENPIVSNSIKIRRNAPRFIGGSPQTPYFFISLFCFLETFFCFFSLALAHPQPLPQNCTTHNAPMGGSRSIPPFPTQLFLILKQILKECCRLVPAPPSNSLRDCLPVIYSTPFRLNVYFYRGVFFTSSADLTPYPRLIGGLPRREGRRKALLFLAWLRVSQWSLSSRLP